MTVSQRIRVFIEHLNINSISLARNLNISKQTISNLLNEHSKPSYDVIFAFVKAYPQLNLYWLIAGDGEMLRPMDSYESAPSDKDTVVSEYDKVSATLRSLLASNMRYLRSLHDKAAQDVCSVLNITADEYAAYEDGRADLTAAQALLLSDIFGIGVQRLLCDDLAAQSYTATATATDAQAAADTKQLLADTLLSLQRLLEKEQIELDVLRHTLDHLNE